MQITPNSICFKSNIFPLRMDVERLLIPGSLAIFSTVIYLGDSGSLKPQRFPYSALNEPIPKESQ